MVGEEKPGVGGEQLPFQRPKPRSSNIPRGSGSDLPAWVAFDRQVLCFDAYFQEAVHEKREEQYRIRNCKIYFYLEDDSIQVIEPRSKNAGIPQGTLIRRHKIPRPPPHDDQFYTVEDFNVGAQITLYSRTFKMTGCNEFTQKFLRKLGVRVNPSQEIPNDPFMNHRKGLDESMQPLRPYEKHDTLKQFLDHDRHVLRFYCHWDDTDNMFGDPRQMVLHYFLADDTLEIREMIPANAGRDATPMFLKRDKLPKMVESLRQPGVETDRTVLNVFGPMGHGGRYILDSLKTGAVQSEFYTDSDLTIGTEMNVWGRKFVLCDCDDFTREYYKAKYGITNMEPMVFKQPGECGVATASREVPPYNGFGSEADSLCSCMGLLPKPPRRDFVKFMEQDRSGLDSNVLRFLAKMNTTKAVDQDRRFIVSYFMSDDTLLVFEPTVRNSGIIGGKFLERGRVKKPDNTPYATSRAEYYGVTDLFVGAQVEFNNHRFVLIDADEYAYNYMERHDFPVADLARVRARLQTVAQDAPDRMAALDLACGLPYEQFRDALKDIAKGQLSEHEIITLARYYQDKKEDPVDVETLVAVAQDQLRKGDFENFSRIEDQCVHSDQTRCGLLGGDAVRGVMSSLRVPIQDDLLRALVAKLGADEFGRVDYMELVRRLNWQQNPVAAPSQGTSQLEEDWQGNKTAMQIQHVDVKAMLQDLAMC